MPMKFALDKIRAAMQSSGEHGKSARQKRSEEIETMRRQRNTIVDAQLDRLAALNEQFKQVLE